MHTAGLHRRPRAFISAAADDDEDGTPLPAGQEPMDQIMWEKRQAEMKKQREEFEAELEQREKRECDEPGCDGYGQILGGLAAMPMFDWWPIKIYRACPECAKQGVQYIRQGQTMDEVAFAKNPDGGYFFDDPNYKYRRFQDRVYDYAQGEFERKAKGMTAAEWEKKKIKEIRERKEQEQEEGR